MNKESKKYFNKDLLFKNFLSSIKKVLLVIGKRAFLVILLLVLLELIVGEFLFYQYAVLVKFKEPQVSVIPTRFKEDVYQSVLKEWKHRDDIFNNVIEENYSNPFR